MIITLADLAHPSAGVLDGRRADLSAHLGRRATDADGLSVAEWGDLPRADGEGWSVSMSVLSRVMLSLDRPRWMRAIADVLEAVLPLDADPRSLAVIPALRSGDVLPKVSLAATAAWAAEGATRAEWVAAEAASMRGVGVAWAAEAAAPPGVDVRAILLAGWERG